MGTCGKDLVSYITGGSLQMKYERRKRRTKALKRIEKGNWKEHELYFVIHSNTNDLTPPPHPKEKTQINLRY
jgi:hypothetical protein